MYAVPGERRERIDRFVRGENIVRFGRLLALERDETECQILSRLIAKERGARQNAGDRSG